MKNLISILLILFISANIQAQEVSKKELRYKPINLTDAVAHLKKIHNDTTRKKIMEMSESDFVGGSHLAMGMWIRNNWGLWRGGQLTKHFNSIGIYHPDDMSGIILTSYHRELNNLDWKVEEQIKEYQDFWKKSSEHQRRLKTDTAYQREIQERRDSLENVRFLEKKNKMKPGRKVSGYVGFQCRIMDFGDNTKIEATIVEWKDKILVLKIDKFFEPKKKKRVLKCNKAVNDIIELDYYISFDLIDEE